MTRYLSLSLFKQYLIGQRTDPNNPTVFNGAVSGTPDDNILTDVILQAEATFDMMTSTGFDEQTYTSVEPIQSFVDGYGWLNLLARERGPISAVSAVSVRILAGANTAWQSVTWDAANDIILPSFDPTIDTYPRPESWRCRIYPANALPSSAPGEILVRWTYTGGFATIPEALSLQIAYMALYIYKTRETPVGRIVNAQLGSVVLPSNFPPSVIAQTKLWSPVYG